MRQVDGDHGTRVYEDIFAMMPSVENPTPLVKISARMNPAPAAFTLFAKLEWMNPTGSVKDRAAWEMLRELEEKGALRRAGPNDEGRGIVEPTSGNTGLSLAALASARGYAMRAVVPARVPLEKRVLLRIAGAEVDVINDSMCPSPGLGEGSIGIARSYAKAQGHKYVMPNQYENEANIRAHERTTGPEIWRQTAGKVTHVFTALGTAGTVMGMSRFLKRQNPGVKVVAVAPSPGHDVPGIRSRDELHVSALFDEGAVDEILEIEPELAFTRAVELARSEGLLAGPSSALIYEGAQRIIERDYCSASPSSDQIGQRTPGAAATRPASEAVARRAPGIGVAIFCDNVFKYTSSMAKHRPELGE